MEKVIILAIDVVIVFVGIVILIGLGEIRKCSLCDKIHDTDDCPMWHDLDHKLRH